MIYFMKSIVFQQLRAVAPLFAAVMAAVSCGSGRTDGTAGTDVAEEIPAVTVQQVFAEDVPQYGVYTSTVQAFVKNNIAPQSAGRITEINVEIGDYVSAGQVLAEMDGVNLMQAKLKMLNDSTEFSRLSGLYEAGGLSKSDLDAMELSYNVSRSSYENLLENTVLTSPVDGVISARNYDRGDMYALGQPIYVLEQIVPVKLLVGISEVDYTKVHKGDKVELSVDAFPGKTFRGEISRIYPTIDPATHTFMVEIIVPNRDRVLRPGMFARVRVLFGVNRSVVVPDAAIVKQTGSGERFVYVLNEDGTVTYRKVTLGVRMDSRYEVLSGIADGDKIVTEGQIRLKSGIKVSVKE